MVNIDQQDPREEYLLIPGQNSKEKPQGDFFIKNNYSEVIMRPLVLVL